MPIFSRFRRKITSALSENRVSSVDVLNVPACMNRLQNMKDIGFSPKVIFDCGASLGYWSWEVRKIFEEVQLIAIEPNEKIVHKTKELLFKITPKPIVEQCAIGAENGVAYLNIWDNEETSMGGSSLKDHVQGDPQRKLEVALKKLDSISDELGFKPDLVKLDLQGYELEALKGASELLHTTEAFVIEFSCLHAYIDRTTPFDLIKIMHENDYCLYDIVDLIYRPYDNALTGGDFFFLKNDSSLREHKGYN